MIKKPTVLVLGAGASRPYGLPTGLELKDMTIQELRSTSGDGLRQRLSEHGHELKIIDEFCNRLIGSRKQSIDAFVEVKQNHKFLKIAQLSITFILSTLEDKTKLCNQNYGKCWYTHLWNELSDHISFEDFSTNKLSIITFNYDRSIEYFLIKALEKLYNKDIIECMIKLSEIPIIHVYGQLGPLPYLGEVGKSYGNINRNNMQEIELFSDQIKIPTKPNETTSQLREAHNVISAAKRIYFLGFGYDDANLIRLELKDRCKKVGPNDLKGTGRGLKRSKISKVKSNWGIEVDKNDHDVLEFLQNEVIF